MSLRRTSSVLRAHTPQTWLVLARRLTTEGLSAATERRAAATPPRAASLGALRRAVSTYHWQSCEGEAADPSRCLRPRAGTQSASSGAKFKNVTRTVGWSRKRTETRPAGLLPGSACPSARRAIWNRPFSRHFRRGWEAEASGAPEEAGGMAAGVDCGDGVGARQHVFLVPGKHARPGGCGCQRAGGAACDLGRAALYPGCSHSLARRRMGFPLDNWPRILVTRHSQPRFSNPEAQKRIECVSRALIPEADPACREPHGFRVTGALLAPETGGKGDGTIQQDNDYRSVGAGPFSPPCG
ncbi:hypothetical protein P7K49_000454 [Saguinus oedipus]|uniref:Uncharacterized protein n=1 Tax=Saguinus oedipus TaxID=9490 RepID=A0ABQ9WBQ0_SAGOE|nr:hypothetical protein P7K49_000454 [Saguinus oedipus]